jgi:hypothetical protein
MAQTVSGDKLARCLIIQCLKRLAFQLQVHKKEFLWLRNYEDQV